MTAGPYAAIIAVRFRLLLQYRAAAIAGVCTQIFFGLVLIMVYEAFYSSATVATPIAFSQLASYVWLGQALIAMLPWNVDAELRMMIRNGAVAYELCRPIDLYSLWYARAFAHRTAPTLLRLVPLTVFAAVVLPLVGLDEWRLSPPASLHAALGFCATLACSLVLVSAISTLINISLMWTISGDGIAMLIVAAVALLSGIVVPLPLYPDWAQTIISWLPFAGVIDQPFRIYTGHLALGDVPLVMVRQLGWALVLVGFGRWLLRRGMRRIVVQGG